MYCPRLDHNVRLNPDKTVSLCGHMINAPKFQTYDSMVSSEWLQNVKSKMLQDCWPDECQRCRDTEEVSESSIRLNVLKFHQTQTKSDYLVVGGVLDNICNSACLSCNETLSTKIGSLSGKNFIQIDNVSQFQSLPIDRIVHLDINGGEPSASKNYQNLLDNLPPNVESVRVNTNCSKVMTNLETLAKQGIKITVTVSLDAVYDMHDIVRWPIKWNKFYKNLMLYKQMQGIELNTWTTVSALNLSDFENILEFVKKHQLDHSYAFLSYPKAIDIRFSNSYTKPYRNLFPNMVAVDRDNQEEIDNFLKQQYSLRNIF